MAGKKGKASSRDLATLAGLMEILLKSGVPILEAMAITAERLSNKALSAAVKEGAKEIKKGGGLSQTLKKYPKLFPAEFVALLEVGETKGVIDVMFEKLALFYAQDPAVR
jgi:type IV pilus assembly protein PilC